MIVECVVASSFKTNAYLVGCEKENVAIIIDPAAGSKKRLLECASENDLRIQAIYITHSHMDHIGDVRKIKKEVDAPVFIHELEKGNMIKPGTDGLPNFLLLKGMEPDGYIEDGQQIQVGSLSFQVIHSPGHTPGCCCFYFEKERALFSGDVLFKGAYGRVDFPTSDEKAMFASLKRLMELPEDVIVHPGHNDSTTIEQERSWLCP